MQFKFIQGEFNANDAIELITQLIEAKIKYHEHKIYKDSNEEDIKNRESKIKYLQNELITIRKDILSLNKSIKLESTINIE